MVVVPKSAFEKLNGGLSERSSELKRFDFKDFVSNVSNVGEVAPFMRTIDLDFVGEGSSRIAFLIPKGACLDAKNRAVCLKVAKNMKGVGQNKAEKSIIDRYGREEACFPEIFAYDKARNISLETEIGSSLDGWDLKEYFKDWNSFLMQKRSLWSLISNSPFKKLSNILRLESVDDLFFVLVQIKDFRHMDRKWKKLADLYVKTISSLGDEHKKYAGIASLVKVLFKKGADAELILGDFRVDKNYAMVDRGEKEPTLIPIDYGFTEDVYEEYYK